MNKHLVIGIGEILWDLLPDGKQMGGAPANFAFNAMALGAESYIISAVGADTLGKEILDRVQEVGLDPRYIAVSADRPTGTVSVDVDNSGVPSFTIHTDTAWDTIVFTQRERELAAVADAVCFGTLAQRSETSRKSILRCLDIVPPDSLRVFDINLRQSYYNKEIVLESLRQCNILKLNNDELPVVAAIVSEAGSELDILQKAVRDFDLKLVALTLGDKGSWLVTATERSFMEAADVPVVDTIGAGDAFTAALTVGLLERLSLRVIHKNATRLAGFVCTQRGALADMEAIRKFME